MRRYCEPASFSERFPCRPLVCQRAGRLISQNRPPGNCSRFLTQNAARFTLHCRHSSAQHSSRFRRKPPLLCHCFSPLRGSFSSAQLTLLNTDAPRRLVENMRRFRYNPMRKEDWNLPVIRRCGMPPVYTIQQMQARLTPVFRKNCVRKTTLFGSYSRGQATASSDIDLLVMGVHKQPRSVFINGHAVSSFAHIARVQPLYAKRFTRHKRTSQNRFAMVSQLLFHSLTIVSHCLHAPTAQFNPYCFATASRRYAAASRQRS